MQSALLGNFDGRVASPITLTGTVTANWPMRHMSCDDFEYRELSTLRGSPRHLANKIANNQYAVRGEIFSGLSGKRGSGA